MILNIFGDEYRSWRSYHAVCPPPSSSLLRPNSFHIPIFSNAPSLCSQGTIRKLRDIDIASSSILRPNLFHIPIFSNALTLCSQGTIPWFLPGRAEEDNEKARLKNYQCTGRDSNVKTTGYRYRINATNLCAVYISSFCGLVKAVRVCIVFRFLNQRFVCRIQAAWRCAKRSAGRQEGSACCWRREVALSCCEHGAARPTRSMLYLECGDLNLKRTMCACWTRRVHSTHPRTVSIDLSYVAIWVQFKFSF